MSKKVVRLVVAPHPDDEVLGCGGVIAKCSASGDQVHVLIVTRGAPDIFDQKIVQEVREECVRANEILGTHKVHFFDYFAPKLDTYEQREIASSISELVEKVRPEVVYIPHYGDLHFEHVICHRTSLVACRPTATNTVKKIYAYETLSETDWSLQHESFAPNVFVNISDHLEKKIEAMSVYRTQLYPSPSNRSIDCLRALSRVRGGAIHCDAAEAFELVREIES